MVVVAQKGLLGKLPEVFLVFCGIQNRILDEKGYQSSPGGLCDGFDMDWIAMDWIGLHWIGLD